MGDWSRLAEVLAGVERSVRFTWAELDALVGGLPASARNHQAWWGGDRPHVKVWRRAGFRIEGLVRGHEVSFVRVGATTAPAMTVSWPQELAPAQRLLLVTCVKEKLAAPAAARDLYVSPLFKKERAYAETSGLPWFILSAEHGLVAPDEWLAPYERYLPDTPRSYRAAWGVWVTERLELLAGSLRGRVVEVHASEAYVDALRGPFGSKGATIVEPLKGLTLGQRLAWYAESVRSDRMQSDRMQSDRMQSDRMQSDRMRDVALKAAPAAPAGQVPHADTNEFCRVLTDPDGRMSPAELLGQPHEHLQVPGLYSWWVDAEGALELTTALGLPVEPGLVYAGLAGATRWPSGRRSTNTLWSRIAGMHLGQKHEFSTFRRTLGSILVAGGDDAAIDEVALSAWMHAHLQVKAVPFPDADTLGRLEEDVVARLDPPLNLQGMPATPLRTALRELRRPHGRKRR
jgi:hypothetical protein